jgi:hypothetical protein
MKWRSFVRRRWYAATHPVSVCDCTRVATVPADVLCSAAAPR